MNRTQKIAIAVGALVIALLALFPPWYCEYANSEYRGRNPTVVYGPHWMLSPPDRPSRGYATPRIDHSLRASLQLAALVLTVASIILHRGVRGASQRVRAWAQRVRAWAPRFWHRIIPNRRQGMALAGGLALILLLFLLPVWFRPGEYTWGNLAWWPPSPTGGSRPFSIEWKTTFLLQAVLLALTVAAVMVLKDRKA